jgi:hypothetical protein
MHLQDTACLQVPRNWACSIPVETPASPQRAVVRSSGCTSTDSGMEAAPRRLLRETFEPERLTAASRFEGAADGETVVEVCARQAPMHGCQERGACSLRALACPDHMRGSSWPRNALCPCISASACA